MTPLRCPSRLRPIRSALCLLLLCASVTAGLAQEVPDATSLLGDILSAASTPKVDTLQQSGAAVTRIPVQVPPGRLGLAPQLALAYNSYARNGWLGVGFGLEIGAIQRSTKWGVDYQGRDFSVSLGGGADELVARPDWGGAMYGARIESAFTKYLFKGATDGWEAWLKDGRRLYFGSSAAARQDDPANPARVFKWCLDRVEDSNGNWMSIEYVKDRGELYPARIAYTGNRGLAPSNTVLFHLEDRPDWAYLFGTNFGVATAKRLKTIEVHAGGALVRAYALAYTLSPSTGRSLLAHVQQFGVDSRIGAAGDIVSGSTLPPAAFEWQADAPGAFTRPAASASVTQSFRFDGSRDQALPFDFDGDGRMDLFFFRPGSSMAAVMRSNGDGSFTQTVFSGAGFAGYNLRHQDDKAIAFDFDGDGRSDLFFYRPDTGNVGIVRSNGDGSFTAVYLSDFGIGGYDFRSLRDRVFAFDFNGDGKSDLCFHRPGDGLIFILRSNGDGSFTPVFTSWSGIAGFDLMNRTDRVFAFDFDGDGRSDLCLYRPDRGLISIARSNGDGSFATAYLSGNGIAGYDLRGRRDVVMPFDFNGDGKGDLFIYRPDGGLACVARSNGDGTFSQAYLSWNGIAGYDLRGSADQVMPFDFNGDGLSDLFIYRPDGGLACVARSNGDGSFTQVYLSWGGIGGYDLLSARDVAFPLDFDGNGKSGIFLFRPRGGTCAVIRSGTAVPDLLSRVDNGFGGVTTLTYTASSAYPNRHLPFVVHPVSAIEAHDGLPESPASVMRFDYRGGHYDVAERQFRGFETITQTRPDGTAQVTVFHQDTHLQGKTRRTESRESPAGAVMARTDFTWDTAQLRGGAATFVRLARRLSTVYDGETVATDESYVHDEENGNLLRTATSGTGAESVVRTTAWRNVSAWLFRPTAETLEGSVSGKLRATVMEYEARTGNLKSRAAWLDGGADPTTTFDYDAFGNPVAATDPLGHVTHTEYDPETRTFPVRVQAPRTGEVEHATQAEVDPRFGKPKATVDANGNRTGYAYDEFGRLVATFAPDGGEARVEYFDDGVPALVVARVKENESGGWIRRLQYVDGFGRTVQTVAFGEGGKPIVQRLFYDAMGRNHYGAGPFFAAGSDYPQALPQPPPVRADELRPARPAGPGREARPRARGGRPRLRPVRPDRDGDRPGRGRPDRAQGLPRPGGGGDRAHRGGRLRHALRLQRRGRPAARGERARAGGRDELRHVGPQGRHGRPGHGALVLRLRPRRPPGRADRRQGPDDRLQPRRARPYRRQELLHRRPARRLRLRRPGRKRHRPPLPGRERGRGDDLPRLRRRGPRGRGRPQHPRRAALLLRHPLRLRHRRPARRHALPGRLPGDLRLPPRDRSAALGSRHHGLHRVRGDRILPALRPGPVHLLRQRDGDHAPVRRRLGAAHVHRDRGPSDDRAPHQELQLQRGRGHRGHLRHRHRRRGQPQLPVRPQPPAGGRDERRRARPLPTGRDRARVRQPVPAARAEIRLGGRDRARDRLRRQRQHGTPAGSVEPRRGGARALCHVQRGQPAGADRLRRGNRRHRDRRGLRGRVGRRLRLPDRHGIRAVLRPSGSRVPLRRPGTPGRQTRPRHAPHVLRGRPLRGARRRGNQVHLRRVAADRRHRLLRPAFLPQGPPRQLDARHRLRHREAVVETADYLPFGVQRSHSGASIARHKYTDQEEDAETGLYNYNARLYDPAMGLFITPDSLISNPYDPQNLNRYAYARNNPLTFTDPSGHDALE